MEYNCGCLIVVMHRTFTTWQKYMNNLFFAVYPYPHYMSFLLLLRLWWNGGGQKQAKVPEKRSPCIAHHATMSDWGSQKRIDALVQPINGATLLQENAIKFRPPLHQAISNDFMLKITYFHMRCFQFPLELCSILPSFLNHSAYHKPWLIVELNLQCWLCQEVILSENAVI